jgi:hypothetical protein
MTDALLDMADKLIGGLFGRARKAKERRYVASTRDVGRLMRLFDGTIEALAIAQREQRDGFTVVDEVTNETATVIGTTQNFLGSGGNDNILQLANGNLVALGFDNSGALMNSAPLTHSHGGALTLSQGVVIGSATGALGTSGPDLFLQRTDRSVIALEFGKYGQISNGYNLVNSKVKRQGCYGFESDRGRKRHAERWGRRYHPPAAGRQFCGTRGQLFERHFARWWGDDSYRHNAKSSTITSAATGNVTLTGGQGYDTYQFGTTFGQDVVNNVSAGGTSAQGEIDFASGITNENL